MERIEVAPYIVGLLLRYVPRPAGELIYWDDFWVTKTWIEENLPQEHLSLFLDAAIDNCRFDDLGLYMEGSL